ncbi:MAG TPA: FAD:protein FMN transferase [Pirellula sp.]|nr:FAD:protein FMN transferase [Pirellula sp.]
MFYNVLLWGNRSLFANFGVYKVMPLMISLINRITSFAGCLLVLSLPAQSQELAAIAPKDLNRFEFSGLAMGSNIDMVVYAQSRSQATIVIDAGLAEIERLTKLLSNYDSKSEISKFCSSPSGQKIPLSQDLSIVLEQSQRWHRLSDGKFDITVGPLTQLWRNSRKRNQLPTLADIADAKHRCGWRYVGFDSAYSTTESSHYVSATLLKPEMILDLSGIAVGYIVDSAFEKMMARGFRSILLNAGGDIRVGDAPPGSEGWRITIAGLGKAMPPLAMLQIRNCSVTTSGDLNQYLEIDGRRYSHFIDPESGDPIERRQSVTAIAATTLDADAGATTLAILGMNRTTEIINSLPLDEVIFVEAGTADLAPIRMRWLTKK